MRATLILTICIYSFLFHGSEAEFLQSAEAAQAHIWQDAGDVGDGELRVPTRIQDGQMVIASYRFETFGTEEAPTEVAIRLRSKKQLPVSISLEGPFNGGDAADLQVPGAKPPLTYSGDGEDVVLSLALPRSGVYRILPVSEKAQDADSMLLSIECKKNCSRTVVSLTDIRDSVHAKTEMQRAALIFGIKAAVGRLAGKNKDWGAQVVARLTKDLNGKNIVREIQMPEVSRLSELMPSLEGMDTDPNRGNAPANGTLTDLLGTCDFDRSDEGKPIHPNLQSVKYGHYNSQTLSRCEMSHSVKLARLLTALALNKPGEKTSVVILDNGVHATSAQQVFDYLISTGHHIEMRHERTYANFISLKLAGNKESRIPFMLDTGVKLSNGKPLVVPMGHAQAMWRIWGPQVRARIAFYLGISGAGFYPMIDSRPAWTGLKRLRSYVSAEKTEKAEILEAVQYSEVYLRRNRIERAEDSLPVDGYGILGVCNDSTAVVERKKPWPFPLLRRSDYDSRDLGDGLNGLLTSLPKDTDIVTDTLEGAALASRRKSIFCRVLNMSPHKPISPLIWSEELREGLTEAVQISPECFR